RQPGEARLVACGLGAQPRVGGGGLHAVAALDGDQQRRDGETVMATGRRHRGEGLDDLSDAAAPAQLGDEGRHRETVVLPGGAGGDGLADRGGVVAPGPTSRDDERDRKSTRLNSSHVKISYAVFCLKKKKKNSKTHTRP